MPVVSPQDSHTRPEATPSQSASASARTGLKLGPKRFLLPVTQGCFYTIVCLAALELFFASAHLGESEYLMPDPVCGFTLMPNKVITQRTEGFGSFKSNSFGMQNAEITVAKLPGTVRIAVFGDSYVESLHVDRSQNFLQTAARNLADQLHQPVQVLNFGVSNYSVAQDYLRYQKIAKQFKPDLVIQVFRVEESDKLLPQPSHYLSLVRPVFFVGPHGELVYDDTNVQAFLKSSPGKSMVSHQWLRQNSRIWSIAGQISQAWASFVKPKSTASSSPTANSSNSAKLFNATAALPAQTIRSGPQLSNKERYINCYWYMMDKQLESFKNECQADGAKFMIMRTPMIKAEMDSLRVNKTETSLLFATAARLNVPILDLDSSFQNQYGLKNDGTHFLSGGHFNAVTHAWVGAQLADYLKVNATPLLTK